MKKQKNNEIRYRMANVNYVFERINDSKNSRLTLSLFMLYKEKYANAEMLIQDINSVNVDLERKYKNSESAKYIKEKFSTYNLILTKREKVFILNYIESINIDLTQEQKNNLIDRIGGDIIHELHCHYDAVVSKQINEFDLKVWNTLSKDANFLDFISTLYRNEEIYYFAHSQHQLINFMEAFGYAKDRNPKLKPYYYKIFGYVIKYFGIQSVYPFNDFYCKKDFMLEYIMNEKSLTKEEKKLFMDIRYVEHFYIAILASRNFTKEEKLKIIDNLNYSEVLNNMFSKNYFWLEKYKYNNIVAFDIEKLFNSSSVEMTQKLNDIIDEKKLPRRIKRYYGTYCRDSYSECELFHASENEMSLEEIKEDYINDFVEMCKFLKRMYRLKEFQLGNFEFSKEDEALNTNELCISLSRIRKTFKK